MTNEAMQRWLDEPIDIDVPEVRDTDSVDELFVHAMLIQREQSQDDREDRIQRTLAAFDSSGAVIEDPKVSSHLRRWTAMASIAASVLLLFAWFVALQPSEADAAIRLVKESFQTNKTQIYQGKVIEARSGSETIRRCTLHCRGDGRFVARYVSDDGNVATVGFDGHDRWVVSDGLNWSSDKQHQSELRPVQRWMIERITFRQLQFVRLFDQIPEHYELDLLPPETFVEPDAGEFVCQPIKATLSNPNQSLPKTIRFWPHPRTGVLLRIELINRDSSLKMQKTVRLERTGEAKLDEPFFLFDTHR